MDNMVTKEFFDECMLAKDLKIRNMEIQINRMKNCSNCEYENSLGNLFFENCDECEHNSKWVMASE